jgi:hypothetical protein
MRRIVLLALAIGLLAPLLAAAPARAQATRTWVSGTGDDVNPCSRTAPCKTFAGAISKTAVAGEINCLDAGGFGTITITKSITLNCTAVLGSILNAGTNGVNINAATTDIVVLRGLQMNGSGTGLVGVNIVSAATVSIENCVITQNTQQGVKDARTAGGTKLFIRDTVISHNGSTGIGLGAANPNNVEIDNTSSINNLLGIAAATGNNALVRRSVLSGNKTAGVEADGGASVHVDNSAISGNVTGIDAGGIIRLSNSDVSFNTVGLSGMVITYGNNRLFGNMTLGGSLEAAGGAANNLGEQ